MRQPLVARTHDVVEIEEPIVNITSLSIKSYDDRKDCTTTRIF